MSTLDIRDYVRERVSERVSDRHTNSERPSGHVLHISERTTAARVLPTWDLAVVVPAHNEAERIAESLTSILNAIKVASKQIRRSSVVVVADRCADNTVAVAQQVLRDHPMGRVCECVAGGVGRARHAGVAVARADLGLASPHRTWIAKTDADTTVPTDWICRQLSDADAGYVAVAGVVAVNEFDIHPDAHRRFDLTYARLLPRDGEHPHVHAANMGIRMDAYERVGGWGRLDRSEDRDLWSRLQKSGARVTSRVELTVTTSGRTAGRVHGGFAHWLGGGFE